MTNDRLDRARVYRGRRSTCPLCGGVEVRCRGCSAQQQQDGCRGGETIPQWDCRGSRRSSREAQRTRLQAAALTTDEVEDRS